jgi:hypothetical protein
VFIAPLLVLVSLAFVSMTLVFRPIELATLFASSAIFAYVSLDGRNQLARRHAAAGALRHRRRGVLLPAGLRAQTTGFRRYR